MYTKETIDHGDETIATKLRARPFCEFFDGVNIIYEFEDFYSYNMGTNGFLP